MKYKSGSFEVDATRWWQNGDHPNDNVGGLAYDHDGREYTRIEGTIVRFFRHPDFPGDDVHDRCQRTWRDHRHIETPKGSHTVCPGDYVITSSRGEYTSCKPDLFEEIYASVRE